MEQIRDLDEISYAAKNEAIKAIEIFESNKLYELNLDINSEQKNMDMDAK